MTTAITIQYFDGCPNWQIAESDLKRAIERTGVDAELRYEKMETHDRAEELGFRGSPTILIGDKDPFADRDAPVGLSCRVYRTDRGTAGSPGIEALVQELDRAR